MSASGDPLSFSRGFDAAPGVLERVSPLVRRIVAPNPSPMTFTGTCAYVVGEGEVLVIDPGPAGDVHVESLARALGRETIAAILVTHTHGDHSPGARRLKALTGAPVLGCAPHAETGVEAADRAHDLAYTPDRVLVEGDAVEAGGARLQTVATPGHTRNHMCFALAQEKALFSGDHVMAWSTTVVIPPDGAMGDYMASLEKLRARDDAVFWPGHGGPVVEPQRYLRALAHHRRQREQAILARLERAPAAVAAIVADVYPGLDAALARAARLSTLAHLEDLATRGLVVVEGAPFEEGARFRLA